MGATPPLQNKIINILNIQRTMIKVNTKKMNEIVKTINEKINDRYKDDDYKMRTYGVSVTQDIKRGDIEVTPNEEDTIYCIEDLVKIANWFEVSFYVTVSGKKIQFRIHSIYKK